MGDALGSRFLPANAPALSGGELPPGPWHWTDDTEMACSLVAVLLARGGTDQDVLAGSFAAHHDVDRGYGRAVTRMLRRIRQENGDWRETALLPSTARAPGATAPPCAAPLGAWYADDIEQAVSQAESSAAVTHRHPDGVAGAVAVGAAAALLPLPAEPPPRRPCSAP